MTLTADAALIVSSREGVREAVARFDPGAVISILEAEETTPSCTRAFAAARHLVIRGNCSEGEPSDCESRAARLIAFATTIDKTRPVLIHCQEGVARSMAAAFIVLCVLNPDADETVLAERIRDAAPHADPNILLVSEADKLLGREDRMIDAILDLDDCAGAVDAPYVTLPIAA